MKYIAAVAGRAYEIEINAEDRITINGQALSIDLHSVFGQPVYSLLVDGRSYEACVQPAGDALEVLLQGRLHVVRVEDERQHRLRQVSAGQALHSGEIIFRSPMPGLIVAVPVAAGQSVTRGQDLVILESMKMQNVLRAPRDGVVSHVRVHAGDSVEQDQILLSVD